MSSIVRFTNPPINEMVIGTQFASHLPLRTLDYADAWSAFGREAYPSFTEVPELAPIAMPDLPMQIIFQFPNAPTSQRYWFLSPTQERLIQVQNNRLLYNWRRLAGVTGVDYPSYDELMAAFVDAYSRFKDFARSRALPVMPQIAEMTYINQIPLTGGFDGLGDIIRGSFNFNESAGLPSSQHSVHFWQYRFDDIKATVNVSANAGLSPEGPVLRLELYIAGVIGDLMSNADIDGMKKRYDIFRERMNALFVAITTDAAHKNWGKY